MATTREQIEEELDETNTAIRKIMVGGQSYKIGSRQLTRADLATLIAHKNDLEATLAEASEGLFDGCYVSYFDRR